MSDIPAFIKNAARDLHWMARRYADGRCSYAPSMFNGRVRDLMAAGFELEQPLFARDGMGRAFDGLSDEEVAAAEEDGMQLHAELNTAESEARFAAVWDQAVEAVLKEINSAHQYYLTRAKNGDEAEAHKAAGVIHVWLSVKALKRQEKTESTGDG